VVIHVIGRNGLLDYCRYMLEFLPSAIWKSGRDLLICIWKNAKFLRLCSAVLYLRNSKRLVHPQGNVCLYLFIISTYGL